MEHILAKGVDRAIRLVHRRRMDERIGGAEPFVVEGNLRRFAAVASTIAGRSLDAVEIRGDTPPRPYWPILYKMAHPALLPEHGFGWSDGETLFLPVSVVETAGRGAREQVTLALVFFLSFQAREGALGAALQERAMLSADRLVADLFWIIENTRLCGEIQREYPGAMRDWAALAGGLLENRPAGRHINAPEKRVEQFLREMARSTFPGAPRSASFSSGSAAESLSLARRVRDEWAAEGLKTGRYRGMVPFFPWGKLIPERIRTGGPSLASGHGGEKDTGAAEVEQAPEGKPRKGARYAARKEQVDEKANENGLTLNIYDKILSWAEFLNVRRPFDDDPDDDPGKKADECEELSVAELGRKTSNTFDAELEKTDAYIDGGEAPPDQDGNSFFYPEWDYRRQAYRPDHSRLVEALSTGDDPEFCERVLRDKRAVIREVTRNLEVISPSTRVVGRQAEGTSIDISAAVDALADMEAGRTPDERLYISDVRTERDLSALFLVDLSMSTDGWAGDAKIIDHEKEALVVLCEALKKLGDRHAVYGFSGKGRAGCRFFRVKGFSEGYGEAVKGRIGGLIPYSYTRMGPAIRHAAGILAAEQARSRLLFILSDGKPNDIDIYEGRYGVEDTRMAIKEAEREGITPFCLTVDTGAADYLPRLFGRGNYAVVPGVETLARRLPELYARIISRL